MYNKDAPVLLIIGVIAAIILLFAVIQSGLLLLAIEIGVVAFAATLVVSRQWQPALWTGGSVAGVIAMIGAFNVLAPGWHQNLF